MLLALWLLPSLRLRRANKRGLEPTSFGIVGRIAAADDSQEEGGGREGETGFVKPNLDKCFTYTHKGGRQSTKYTYEFTVIMIFYKDLQVRANSLYNVQFYDFC